MNKTDFVRNIAEKAEIFNKDAAKIVNMVFDEIAISLQKEDSLTFVGFGRFYKKNIPSKKGRNPRTGEEIQLPAYTKVGFKAGKELLSAVRK